MADPAKYPGVEPFLLQKWDKVFHKFFDVNESKVLDWGDFSVVLRHCRSIYGSDSAQVSHAKSALAALWEGLKTLADKNKDEKISFDEWVAVLKNTDPATEPKWFTDYMKFMFKLFDVSEDDVLDQNEYADGMTVYGVESHAAMDCFKKFCVAPKHVVNMNEFQTLWNDYFYSKDANAAGNCLFGPL